MVISKSLIVFIFVLYLLISLVTCIFMLKKRSNFTERLLALLVIWFIPYLGSLFVLLSGNFHE